jgi:hypothetical protein
MLFALVGAERATAGQVVVYYANGILSTPATWVQDRVALEQRTRGRPEVSSLPLTFKNAENYSAGFIADLVEAAEQLGLQSPTVIQVLQGQLISRFLLGGYGLGSASLYLVQALADYLANTSELTLLQSSTIAGQVLAQRADLQAGGVVVVAHSQGNLFTRDVQNVLLQQGLSTIAVPVGPPDLPPVMIDPDRTRYTLLDEDVVINVLARLAAYRFNLTVPPPANVRNSLPTFSQLSVSPCLAYAAVSTVTEVRDCLFHRFAEDYLEPGSPSEAMVMQNTVDAILLSSAQPSQPIVFSTYLGGPTGGNNGIGNPYALATDSQGNTLVTGVDGPGFPPLKAIQPTIAGSDDIFLTKLDRNGQVVFSTYLGGTPASPVAGEGSTAVTMGPSGEAYLGGFSRGMTWPLLGGQYVDSGWLMRLDPTGSQIELFTTQLYDIPGYGFRFNYPTAIKVAPDGNIVVLGLWTFDPGGGSWSPFLAKFTPQGAPIWQISLSSVMGAAHDLAVDAAGNAYVAGRANALTPVNPIPGVQQDGDDIAVARISDTGAITGLTVIGGTASGFGDGHDAVLDLFVEPSGELTLIGSTGSPNFPTTQGVMGPLFPPNTAGAGFVARLEIGATPGAASTLFASTFIDPAILQPQSGTMATTGEVTLVGYPGAAFTPTTPALGSVGIARLAGDLSGIDYATRFGSQVGTTAFFAAGDQSTDVLVSGTTGAGLPTSATSPTQFPSFQPTHGGFIDAFVAKLAMPAPPPPVPE